jgi:hypothetical protein
MLTINTRNGFFTIMVLMRIAPIKMQLQTVESDFISPQLKFSRGNENIARCSRRLVWVE